MRRILTFVTICSMGFLAFSYAGAWHPAGDSFAVFRPAMAMAFSIIILFVPARGWVRGVGFLAGLVMASRFFMPIFPMVASDYDYVLYQQNLLFARTDRSDWLEAVARSTADMVTLQEVSGANRAVLSALADHLPTQVYCDFAGVGGVAVLSRFSPVAGSEICADRDGLAAVQLETAHGPVWLVSIHLHWPWPYGQAAQVARLMPVLEGFDGHVIIGGDFNAVSWSHAVALMEKASRTQVVGPFSKTFDLHGYPFEIDHILTSPAYAQEVVVMPKLGSDHHGVLAYLTRPLGD